MMCLAESESKQTRQGIGGELEYLVTGLTLDVYLPTSFQRKIFTLGTTVSSQIGFQPA